MPKYSSDRRRYHDEMSNPGRGQFRARNIHDSQRRDERTSSGHYGGSSSRRPGQPSSQPSSSHSAAPYARPSTSTGYHPSGSSSSFRGEHIRQSVDRQESIASETMSTAGSISGVDSTVGRGSMRGRRTLPADIITRPRTLVSKQGGQGEPILLQANYFKLLSTTDWCLYKYRVDFSPQEDRKVVCKGLLRPHRETLGAYIFDGSVLYTSNLLPESLQLTSQRQADNETILINIQHVGDMTKGDHHYIQFFNIIMRKCLDYLQLQLVGRNYFDANNKTLIREHRLELWPGYITSIRQHERDILMCAEITHKVMRNETLLDVLNECYNRNRHDYQNLFAEQVIGVVVLTDYNNNTYRVDDVDFAVNPRSTFKKRTGEEISYYDYYRTRYNINIENKHQPLLVSRSKPRDRRSGQAELVYLVPELCRSTGLTDSMRNNFNLMRSLAQYTRVSPADRIKKLMNFNVRLHSVNNIVSELKSWNLKLDNQLVTVPGRVLPFNKIVYANDSTYNVPNDADWTKDVCQRPLVKCAQLDDWILIVPIKFKRDCQNFVSTLVRVAMKMNFKIGPPVVVDLRNDSADAYTDMLEDIKRKSNPMLIFCVASNNRIDRYSAIKKKCCVDRPVPTQVILAKNLCGKAQMSIATKVAIQMNCKVGGIPWTISIPTKGLMVVGFDVCHDTSSKRKDFGAMVASLDTNFGRYFSAVSSHTSGEELSSDLSVNLCKAIDQFKFYNSSLPKRIVIYRDGVGEGQIPFVVDHEVQRIRTKLEQIYETPDEVKLAYIIVTKKINTRLFDKGSNPPPGTIVDDVVTDPTKYDFMIVAQKVGQGTVTPTSYNVIHDSSGLDVDKIQRLTYKLCHMYFNWSGTVRVPAPCQYAHKLAFLVSQAIHQSPSQVLESLLYFL